ncbi:MAG: hypothetical protein OEM32_09415, partial [Acidimicrobiia bacterium]|nr:hypothetical protein [Acidimicrobiia bacterium]
MTDELHRRAMVVGRYRLRLIGGLLLATLLSACSSGATRATVTARDVGSTTVFAPPSTTTITAPPLKDLTERPQIWFGPLDPWSWDQHRPGAGSFQFYDLFSEGAAWEETADAVHVMRLYPVWLETFASPAELRRVLEDLGRRGIAVSFESGPLTERGMCNASNLEGFSGAGPARAIAERVRDAGGTLYSMDLEHGFDAATYYDEACRMTPTEVARDVANTIEAVRSVFANVRVGSIETADLDVNAVAAWLEAYREVTGEELDYFHLDLDYLRPDWPVRAREIEDYVRSRGIDFGIIYFGDAQDPSDEVWLAKAEQRMVEFEVMNGGRPDHAVFQSWHQHPERLLPETEPGTFTHLIGRYLRSRSMLTLDSEDGSIAGSLVTSEGKPLAGMTVGVEVESVSGQGLVAEHTLTRTVPEGVISADVGYRINTECGCSGPADLVLYEARYMEGASSVNLVPNGDFARRWESWG